MRKKKVCTVTEEDDSPDDGKLLHEYSDIMNPKPEFIKVGKNDFQEFKPKSEKRKKVAKEFTESKSTEPKKASVSFSGKPKKGIVDKAAESVFDTVDLFFDFLGFKSKGRSGPEMGK